MVKSTKMGLKPNIQKALGILNPSQMLAEILVTFPFNILIEFFSICMILPTNRGFLKSIWENNRTYIFKRHDKADLLYNKLLFRKADSLSSFHLSR